MQSAMNLSSVVTIDAHRGSKPYSRMIFGQFLEHFHRQVYGGVFEPGSPLADEHGFRTDVIEALRELRVPVVRWPGGCFVSAYHWADGVGHPRRPAYDKAWRVEDPNTFGTDEFVAWCRAIGAEPYICTNAGTGTPEEMSDWVEYCNLPDAGRWAKARQANGHMQPHHVPYWSIGNENYGDWEMGAKTSAEWGRFVAESAKMMKRVDPSIKLLAAALADVDWTLNLLREAGQYLDMVSIHGYYDRLNQVDEPSDYATSVARSGRVEAAIRLTEQIIGVAGFEGKLGIAFDEWNLRGWHHPAGNSPEAIAARDRNDINATYTMADAVFSAGFLNACLRHADTVRMANMAPVVNTRGPLYVHPSGVVRRTTFHVLSMYANQLGERIGEAFVDSPTFTHDGLSVPALDAIATCDSGQENWKLALVNRLPDQELACRIVVAGSPLEGIRQAVVLDGDGVDAYNDVDNPERVVPQEKPLAFSDGVANLPPHSVVILAL
ncbi:MAG: alpha-L-arabinofuranosidase C-terminal domain-containing protein [Chloroflexota bacterium]|nr:alpha-L-arabinofuranosidase C-terminal domain-containing protein [Chloroflexota bacterium]